MGRFFRNGIIYGALSGCACSAMRVREGCVGAEGVRSTERSEARKQPDPSGEAATGHAQIFFI